MRLSDMIVGNQYIVGDGYGYDLIECLEHNPKEIPIEYMVNGIYWVKVKFVNENGREDMLSETPGSYELYVENVSKN